ncbi:sialate O-acetylesterase [Pontibacter qinzhouensis]|uniref:Sialate O-acetylesterase n=1 Tax=Pontibacter qinzhouensis TaxID=2603253 RepID=A0A5C8KBI6_9BACT|nr:sialate O-acetylesterase [Pontibacter qinzhouensis]TXK52630.1 sialate O-acetylesterase [Pontibacter qinzhouensis]
MRKLLLVKLLLVVLQLSTLPDVRANVQLPAIFGNHMVLQQNAEVSIWGWAKALEEVTVTSSWDQQVVKTTASNQAKWEVKLMTPAAGGPYTIKIEGYNTILLEDVLIGEVWLCSGQSNMEWSARAGIDNAEQAVAEANFPFIRFFRVGYRTADVPQQDLDGQWVVCTPETMKDFSAVAYFFGKDVHQNLNLPVGLIDNSWGGTPAETWVNPDLIAKNQAMAASAATQKEVTWCPVEPGKTYNAMLKPLVPYHIAGVLWYQGESNTNDPENYATLFPTLIQNWRSEWGYEFPFYYVQIAPFKHYGTQAGARLRDVQRRVLQVPNTGMVVVSDIGNNENIHPTNKHDIGKRLANLALNQTYGKKELPYSGPLFREMKTDGNKAVLYFDHADKGLVSKNKKLTQFEIAGSDQKFVKADARIVGNTVVVQAKRVKNPAAVRFEWHSAVEASLFNKEGLPASSFRTDDWVIK